MAESEEELKSLLMKAKAESEKVGLKLNIQKTKIMASGPITSWQTEGGKVEAMIDFLFLGSKITADGGYSHKIKRCLLLGRSESHSRVQLCDTMDCSPWNSPGQNTGVGSLSIFQVHGRNAMTNLDSILKSRNITLTTKVYLCQSYGFSSGHVWM